jgi:hypothetical protein
MLGLAEGSASGLDIHDLILERHISNSGRFDIHELGLEVLGVAGGPASGPEIHDLIMECHIVTSGRLDIHALGFKGHGGAWRCYV